MTGTSRTAQSVRVVVAAVGIALIGVGGWKLAAIEPTELLSGAKWLAGAVIVHDFMLAPVIVLLGVVAARVLPPWAKPPVLVGFVLAGTLVLLSIPRSGSSSRRWRPVAERPTTQ